MHSASLEVGHRWQSASVAGQSPAGAIGERDGVEAGDRRGGRGFFFSQAAAPLTVGAFEAVAAGDGVTGVVGLRPDDSDVRVTYDGRPLYYFAGDEAAGDTNGHGRNDVWYVAAVDGSLPTE